jgi:hypothetical protein
MQSPETLAQAYAEELPWLAFLYVSEDLTPDEVVDLEERLLTDQSAREAVAQAMKMADGMWMASALDSLSPLSRPALAIPENSRDRRFQRLALWIGSTIVAAGLAFCVGWWFAQSADSPASLAQEAVPQSDTVVLAAIPHPIEGAEELVGIWSDSLALLGELDSSSINEHSSESFEEYASRESQEPEEEAFSWMLAALSPADADLPPVTPEVMEN